MFIRKLNYLNQKKSDYVIIILLRDVSTPDVGNHGFPHPPISCSPWKLLSPCHATPPCSTIYSFEVVN